MMISPEYYFEHNLVGKDEKKLMTMMRSLKREIAYYKSIIEDIPFDCVEKQIIPDPDTRIQMDYLYIEQIKKALHNLGIEYQPTKAELKSLELNNRLNFLSKISLNYSSNWSFTEVSVTIDENDIIFSQKTNDGETILKNEEWPVTKEMLITTLQDIHLGDWKRNYTSKLYVLDGTTWSLKLEFSDGKRPIEFTGYYSYPWNFDYLENILTEEPDICL